MLSHVMIGSNNLERSAAFYDQVLGALGAKQFMKMENRIGYRSESGPAVMLCAPFDGEPAHPANGSMLSFSAPNQEAVAAFHAAALANGGTCEGPPGPRGGPDSKAYLAYVRDPDGNKIAAMHRG
ncbi:MAG: VOC family protein [Caulobacterales bacterium]